MLQAKLYFRTNYLLTRTNRTDKFGLGQTANRQVWPRTNCLWKRRRNYCKIKKMKLSCALCLGLLTINLTSHLLDFTTIFFNLPLQFVLGQTIVGDY